VLCARVLMHFPYEEQVAFLQSVASVSHGPVVFTQGVVTPWPSLDFSSSHRRRASAMSARARSAASRHFF
jgi:hypothetical protein